MYVTQPPSLWSERRKTVLIFHWDNVRQYRIMNLLGWVNGKAILLHSIYYADMQLNAEN